MEKNRPWVQTVFLSSEESLISSPMVFSCGGQTSSYIRLLKDSSGGSVSQCFYLWPQASSFPLRGSSWTPQVWVCLRCSLAAPRSWWRSCWGKVLAFHEVVLSTIQMHLVKKQTNKQHRDSFSSRGCEMKNVHSNVFPALTLSDDVDNVIGIEAELIRVLGVIGIQCFALGHLGFGFWCGLGSPSSRRRPAGWWSVGPDKRERDKERNQNTCHELPPGGCWMKDLEEWLRGKQQLYALCEATRSHSKVWAPLVKTLVFISKDLWEEIVAVRQYEDNKI